MEESKEAGDVDKRKCVHDLFRGVSDDDSWAQAF